MDMTVGAFRHARRRKTCFGMSIVIGAAFLAAPIVSGGEPWTPSSGHVEYAGWLDMYGHYARPGQAHRFLATLCAFTDGASFRLEWTTRDSADTVSAVEVTLLRGDSVFVNSEDSWRLLDRRHALQAWLQAVAVFSENGRGPTPPDSDTRSVWIEDDPDHFLRRITHGWAHPRLGDVYDTALCYDLVTGMLGSPVKLELLIHERDEFWKSELRIRPRILAAVDARAYAAPDSFELPGADEDELTGRVEWELLAPGLHLASMSDVQSRSLVVEFADSLVVLEAAVSSANGERLVDAIQTRWPGKPIRWFLFSHHHPHYLGGLRAMVAAGAAVAVTPGNADYVREITTRLFNRAPDRLAEYPTPLNISVFSNRFEVRDSTNRMVAVNIGTRSQHTDEFLVFWFPRQRILFETEQGWFHRDGRTVASRRAAMLLDVIRDEDLDVERIAQSWPMEDTEPVLTRSLLAEMVAARGK